MSCPKPVSTYLVNMDLSAITSCFAMRSPWCSMLICITDTGIYSCCLQLYNRTARFTCTRASRASICPMSSSPSTSESTGASVCRRPWNLLGNVSPTLKYNRRRKCRQCLSYNIQQLAWHTCYYTSLHAIHATYHACWMAWRGLAFGQRLGAIHCLRRKSTRVPFLYNVPGCMQSMRAKHRGPMRRPANIH